MFKKIRLVNIVYVIAILGFDLFIYLIFALLLMSYEDNWDSSKGEFWSLESMNKIELTIYFGLQLWNIINIVGIILLIRKTLKKYPKTTYFIKSKLKLGNTQTAKGAFFNSTQYEMENLLCGIGEATITENKIKIANYPFEPSIVYPKKTILATEIKEMSIDFGVCKIYIDDDIVFISSEKKEELKKFATNNNIKLIQQSWNWDKILEPYVDTEYSKKHQKLTLEKLKENGFKIEEIKSIRAEVKEQMFKYNFDTMLWDWCSLGLTDVLSAMKVKYNRDEFRNFYRRAIEIDKRNKNTLHNN